MNEKLKRRMEKLIGPGKRYQRKNAFSLELLSRIGAAVCARLEATSNESTLALHSAVQTPVLASLNWRTIISPGRLSCAAYPGPKRGSFQRIHSVVYPEPQRFGVTCCRSKSWTHSSWSS
jgi:hypothetical protein